MQLDISFAYSSDFPIYPFFYLSYFLCNSFLFLRIEQNYLFKLVRNPRAMIVKSDGQHVPCRCRSNMNEILTDLTPYWMKFKSLAPGCSKQWIKLSSIQWTTSVHWINEVVHWTHMLYPGQNLSCLIWHG